MEIIRVPHNKYSQQEFIEKCNLVHNNKYDYTSTSYTTSHKSITIICNVHGAFEQKAYSHISGKGCRKCATQKNSQNNIKSLENFLDKSRKAHNDTYDYSNSKYLGHKYRISVICKSHGEFSVIAGNHMYGKGKCPHCAKNGLLINRRKDINRFIREANAVHNNKYVYDLSEYETAHSPIIVTCKIHGEFTTSPNCHVTKKQGCRVCGYISVGNKSRKSLQKFINDASLVHNNVYDYSLIKSYNSGKDYVKIICNTHGEFSQRAENHVNSKNGCPKCGIINTGLNGRKSPKEFINQCKTIHNDEYDYSLTNYTIFANKIIVICKIHGEFEITATKHYSGCGCPKCSKTISKRSKLWLSSFGNENLIPEYALPENKLRKVDGYDPTTNTVYQFHGTYWHSDPRFHLPNSYDTRRNQFHGEIHKFSNTKDQQIRDWGYNLVVMWEYDWQLLNKSLKK